jgi:hypothetical protein
VYDRMKAKTYADRWWNERNPKYPDFSVDCTNFISQCLFAGGAPMNYTNNRTSGWWIRSKSNENWSYSWSVAHSLYWYLKSARSGLTGKQVSTVRQLQIGDVISYDWNGDGRFTHSTMVTAFRADGEPLVNAHTNNSFQRLWNYQDSPAWSLSTRYAFFQIFII